MANPITATIAKNTSIRFMENSWAPSRQNAITTVRIWQMPGLPALANRDEKPGALEGGAPGQEHGGYGGWATPRRHAGRRHFTLPLWVAFAINIAKEGSRTDWLGFSGAVITAFVTLAAGISAWFAVQQQIAAPEEARRPT
jgi:hypothetical protein